MMTSKGGRLHGRIPVRPAKGKLRRIMKSAIWMESLRRSESAVRVRYESKMLKWMGRSPIQRTGCLPYQTSSLRAGEKGCDPIRRLNYCRSRPAYFLAGRVPHSGAAMRCLPSEMQTPRCLWILGGQHRASAALVYPCRWVLARAVV